MGIVTWIFARVERIVFFLGAVVTLVVGVIGLNERLEPTPPPAATADLTALPDTVPVAFSAPLAARLAKAFAAAGCAPGVVSATDYAERITTAGGRDAAFLQLSLATPADPIIVQGNGRGAAALANARANLLDNIEIALKESDACG